MLGDFKFCSMFVSLVLVCFGNVGYWHGSGTCVRACPLKKHFLFLEIHKMGPSAM